MTKMKEKLIVEENSNNSSYLLPKNVRENMKVDGRIIADKEMLEHIEEEAIQQLTNVAMLPGIISPVCAMPDAHWGYGLPMGSVAAFDAKEGIISSGLCGFDINCGINLVKTDLTEEDLKQGDKINQLLDKIYEKVPVGVGTKNGVQLTDEMLNEVMTKGCKWCVEHGLGDKEDLKNIEENGCMEGADPSKVGFLAKKRGLKQLGTLGAGNHFLEIQKVSEIFDKEFAKKYEITKKGQICIMIHTGSRGLGHQIATDYLKIQEKAVKKYNINIPDEQLACAPANSEEAQDYFSAMKCAVNYSFANRLVLTQRIREAFEEVFGKSWKELGIKTVYGLCHNVVKKEKFKVKNGVLADSNDTDSDCKEIELYVHRKGATRSYPDQPVIIAGSMGTSSWLMKGTKESLGITFGSSAHGAGRAMSRNSALKEFDGNKIKKELKEMNIESRAPTALSLAEEAPKAYKDVDLVIESVHKANVSKKVIELKPLGVIKG
jgi:tRNA-splicing ligase RtcB (3'-phosphate/5'-hydroxy nucleic acid ligase)